MFKNVFNGKLNVSIYSNITKLNGVFTNITWCKTIYIHLINLFDTIHFVVVGKPKVAYEEQSVQCFIRQHFKLEEINITFNQIYAVCRLN